jgi:hypothetical protein
VYGLKINRVHTATICQTYIIKINEMFANIHTPFLILTER